MGEGFEFVLVDLKIKDSDQILSVSFLSLKIMGGVVFILVCEKHKKCMTNIQTFKTFFSAGSKRFSECYGI